MATSARLCFLALFPTLVGVNGDISRNQDDNYWYKEGVKLIKDNLEVKPYNDTAKSAILFLGGGMGLSTITATRFLDGQLKGNTGEENVLSWEEFPWSALAKPYAVNLQGTDSASSATALLNGIKTNEGILGVDESVRKGYCADLTEQSKAVSILALAERAGMSTGIVTTTRVSDATPASAYAYAADRSWEADADIEKLAKDDGSKCKDIGLFEYSHMQFEVDRASDKAGEPSIEEMTAKAIEILRKNPKGYFLLVEAGRIDHGHHDGKAVTALYDAVAMNKAVARTLEIVNRDETLITVTADHSHVFTIGGYPKRGNPVFGLIRNVDNTLAVDTQNRTYTTLGYADGPGGLNGSRPDLRNANTFDKDYLQQATVLLDAESHSSEDIAVFADGPGAYLFHGVVEQQYVFHVMDHALCLSESKQKSCEKHVNRGGVSGNIFQNQDRNSWYKDGVNLVKDNLKLKPNTDTAKSAVLFLGDGMGLSTITATRFLDGQLKGNTGEENVLSWEVFPWSALAKPYAVNQQGPDSASTATAFLNGIKTNVGMIGVDERVRRGSCADLTEQRKVVSILALAEKAGMSTGIVTTTRVSHATPASAYAYAAERNWEADKDIEEKAKDDGSNCKDIALQLVEFPLGDGMEVVFGGGRSNFLHINQSDPEYPDKKGRRQDGRDLIQMWLDNHTNSQYVWNKTQFDQIDVQKVDHVIGLFEYSHMQYEVDRASDKAGEPSIEEMTEKAIKILQKNPKGYFLLVEGGRIDLGHHVGWAVTAVTDAVAMNKAVARTLKIVNKDETLITVTADHSHVFTIGGYPKRGNPVFGLIRDVENKLAVDTQNRTYTTLGYANGPGGLNGSRPDLRSVNTSDKYFRQQATVLLNRETHSSEDVGVFADGPGAYLFHGVVEQQYVFHVMDHALCLSEIKQRESCVKHVNRGGKPRTSALTSGGRVLSVAPLSALLLIALSWVL